jgi:hypothetical protein
MSYIAYCICAVAQLLQIAAVAVVQGDGVIEDWNPGGTKYFLAVNRLSLISPTLLPLLSTIIATGLSGLSRQVIFHLV